MRYKYTTWRFSVDVLGLNMHQWRELRIQFQKIQT